MGCAAFPGTDAAAAEGREADEPGGLTHLEAVHGLRITPFACAAHAGRRALGSWVDARPGAGFLPSGARCILLGRFSRSF